MSDDRYIEPRRPKRQRPVWGGKKLDPRRTPPEFEPAPEPAKPSIFDNLILSPEMVPEPLWGRALRTDLGTQVWLETVSRPIRRFQNVCEMCRGLGLNTPTGWRTCCHEVWDYSEADEALVLAAEMLDRRTARARNPRPKILKSVARQVASDLGNPTFTAHLLDLRCVCWRCNQVIHWGHTESTTPAQISSALAHGAKVNRMSVEDMTQVIAVAKAAWLILSQFKWDIAWRGWERMRDRKTGRAQRRSGWSGIPPTTFDL